MNYFFLTLLLIVPSLFLNGQADTRALLPGPFELPGMQLAGEPELYTGEELFDLINGGAEVYLEYGFVEVASQNYIGISGTTNLRIEIYKMSDAGSAFGILMFSTLGMEIIDKTAYFLASGKGFGMMQKGQYFVMASYANIDETIQKSMLERIVSSLDKQIGELSRMPAIMVNTRPPCKEHRQALYFRGNLALQNVSYLDFSLPFIYSEGVFYRCDVFEYIMFALDDDKSKKVLIEQTISNILRKNPELSSSKETFGFSVREGEYLRYEILPESDFLVLIKYQ